MQAKHCHSGLARQQAGHFQEIYIIIIIIILCAIKMLVHLFVKIEKYDDATLRKLVSNSGKSEGEIKIH